ncbi:MAG: UDP-3-O-(3-hydroxymyristoyl)glucosamine N-acyltransferase [Planctomycetota bacterium]
MTERNSAHTTIVKPGQPLSLEKVAEMVGGQLLNAEDSNDALCEGVDGPAGADETCVTMAADEETLRGVQVGSVLAVFLDKPHACDHVQIIVDDVHSAMATLAEYFRPEVQFDHHVGIHPSAVIAEDAKIHPNAIVGPGTIIGSKTRIDAGVVVGAYCRIGSRCVINPGVTIYAHCIIKDDVRISAASTIGAEGFGYRFVDGQHMPAAQFGYVVLEEKVDLGAGVTVDRGAYGSTRIGCGTKIDNQVMVAHNCQIGRHNLICSQVGIAGSCVTGDHVILAGQVGLKDHITLGDRTVVGAQAGVMDNLEGNNVYLGSPATTQRDQMQIMAVERRLPQMRKDLKQMSSRITEVETRLNASEDASAKKAA